jgi:dephospho-CoA kinase
MVIATATDVAPKVVGLTGGICSGKSTVRRLLEQLGVPCLDADVVARDVHQNAGHPATIEIGRTFPQAMSPDGRLRRGSLHEIFAADPGSTARLTALIAPHVVSRMQKWTGQQKAPYVAWECAILVEARISVDRIAVVDASRQTQIARLHARNPDWTTAQIDSVLALQLPREDRLSVAQDIVCNDGTLEQLGTRLRALHHAYLRLWKKR